MRAAWLSLDDERTLLVVGRNRHGSAVKMSRQQLAALPHVAVELAPGRGFRDPVAAAYTRAGIERQVAMTVPSFSAAAAVVATTPLVTTLPRSLFVVQGARRGRRAVKGPSRACHPHRSVLARAHPCRPRVRRFPRADRRRHSNRRWALWCGSVKRGGCPAAAFLQKLL